MKNRKPVPKVKINSHVAETLKRESRVCQIREKINRYQDSKVEYKRCGTAKAYLLFKLGRGSDQNLMMWVTKIGTPGILKLLHEACLLRTASKVLRRTLDT